MLSAAARPRGNLPRPNITKVTPGTLANDRTYTVLIRMRLVGENASVEVQLDGKTIHSWAGPAAGVAAACEFCLPPGRPVLASYSTVTFHSARMRLLSVKAAVLPR